MLKGPCWWSLNSPSGAIAGKGGGPLLPSRPLRHRPTPCMIFVSKEGKWYHEGAEIIHRAIFLWMIQSLEKTEEDLFIVHLNNQKCYLEVEDTPLVVQQVDLIREVPGEQSHIRLTLNDESREILDPETL